MARRRIHDQESSSDSEDERVVPISWDSIPKAIEDNPRIAEEPKNDRLGTDGAWGFVPEDPMQWVEDSPDMVIDTSEVEDNNRYLFEDEDQPQDQDSAPTAAVNLDEIEGTLGFQSALEDELQEEFHSVNETFADQGQEQQRGQDGDG
jgi:hypothetical protein